MQRLFYVAAVPEPGTRTADYDFELPPALIAQHPAARRDESRLMVVNRNTKAIEHRRFSDLVDLIPSGDLLVVNRSRVIRARLLGHRDSGAPAEIMILQPRGDNVFEAMVSPGGKLKPGRRVTIADDLSVEILEVTERRTRLVRLHTPLPADEALEKHGHIPLPPYIERADAPDDVERYQTVYAQEPGSVAAPTAGLHFTNELLSKLSAKGVGRAEVILHVGAGTFKPVEVEDPAGHQMHSEWFTVPPEAEAAYCATRANGNRIWAVGTTSVRTLESAADDGGRLHSKSGDTVIFIRPPYHFRAIDHLITNFHLPRSTLLMLVAAFAGYDLIMRAYREAIAAGYRFYSYGDPMVII